MRCSDFDYLYNRRNRIYSDKSLCSICVCSGRTVSFVILERSNSNGYYRCIWIFCVGYIGYAVYCSAYGYYAFTQIAFGKLENSGYFYG